MKAIALKSFGMLALVLMSFSLMSLTDGSSRKFWGSDLTWGACGPNTDGSPGCFQGQYSTYYVFWIATGDPEPTGVIQSCTCP